MKKYYPNVPESDLETALNEVRKHHGRLSGLSLKTIRTKVYKYIHKTNKDASETTKDDKCPICFEHLSTIEKVSLKCKHIFHNSCIKTWLQTNSVCPICRVYTIMDDDYPPLSSK